MNENPSSIAACMRVAQRGEEFKRVAIYARVASVDHLECNPLRNQVESLEGIIRMQPEWICVGIYADARQSGNCAERPGLQRLLADCRARRIDLILAKSVSRVARDSDLLVTTLQHLRRQGIDVYFEEEGIYASQFPTVVMDGGWPMGNNDKSSNQAAMGLLSWKV